MAEGGPLREDHLPARLEPELEEQRSDWPVWRQAGVECEGVVRLCERLVSRLAPGEADALWRGNAERFYAVRVA